ncbi:hypothetical protein AXX17_AT1G52900 [Arabidopsis thaliana]|uniref:Cullin N-terminal domain-containing protein n=1 Tax=Arabidopsis thaliana TaxID=3702 RepID=A0A178WA74_ARATH|nr:hypothetical protein AXX17_AT1G52900 [Arabidopsis thaliana]
MDSRRMSRPRQIKFEEGWSNIQKGITKLIRILEGEPEPTFYFSECFKLYTIIYDMCVQRSDYSQQLYEKYRKVIEDYTIQTVLPSLREKHDEDMLRELVKRWNNHKIMVKWLSKFFVYIDRHLVRRSKIPIPSLDEVGLTCFLDLVYCEMQSTAKEAVIALIHKEREGEQIDRALVKNVLDIYVENGMGTLEKYEEDFESFMLQDTASYYSRKASRATYRICAYKNPQQLYDKYRELIENYAIQTVLPSLREKHDECMLRELAKRWNAHKLLVRLFSRRLVYLDDSFLSKKGLPSLREVGLNCFRDQVYREMQSMAAEAILALIHKEREGEQIDRELVRNVIDVFVENGMGTLKKYEEDFERLMLQDTASYYSSKASRWIQEESCLDYTLKAYL